MKKAYVRPTMASEQFVANEYIAGCWNGSCNISGKVYLDSNGNGVYDAGIDKYSYENTACQKNVVFRDVDSSITSTERLHNAFVVGEHTKWVYETREVETIFGSYQVPGWWPVTVKDVTKVFNWDDHVATLDSITRHEKPNHS